MYLGGELRVLLIESDVSLTSNIEYSQLNYRLVVNQILNYLLKEYIRCWALPQSIYLLQKLTLQDSINIGVIVFIMRLKLF